MLKPGVFETDKHKSIYFVCAENYLYDCKKQISIREGNVKMAFNPQTSQPARRCPFRGTM
ncbi:hypothetical protein PGQ11_011664 [Apiospora arundinis]|uniref:Uncharacterized protein n=1 Tax=Apiospora arundinis TaxID=335852 RepID=A0ABR2I153_9PEZI